MPELKLTIEELQIALGRFFGEVGYRRYCELCGGFGDISEEEWEFYEKLNFLLNDKIHPPFLEKMIRLHSHSMNAINSKDD